MVFSTNFRDGAYWLDALADSPASAASTDEASAVIPPEADVVVVGSGYTGLHAAVPLARAGREVVVLEAGSIGHGCSRRNGGQVSGALKPDLATLTKRYGSNTALALLREGLASVDWLQAFIERENIDCQFERSGSFHGAHSPRQFLALQRGLAAEHSELRTGSWLVEPSEMHREIGTASYYGGIVNPKDGSLHPALYHQALVEKAELMGVTLRAHCAVTGIVPAGVKISDRVRVTTSRGTILAREVVVATNGYTGKATPWLRRRVIPIGSYMIATEPLPAAVMDQILPTNRVICDTRKVVYYYRPSPDRQRVIFGGRVSAGEVTPAVSGPRLHQALCRLFPQLAEIKISHSWMGKVAFTFDDLAHMGKDRHVHYALGYCGSGIAMSSYLGMQVGEAIVNGSDQNLPVPNARPALPFRGRPYYSGRPWFLGAAIQYYRLRDRFG